MKKLLGLLVLFVVVFAYTAIANPQFMDHGNLVNLLRWTGLYGILGIGVALVIITGGIDLSLGSVVCLSGVVLYETHIAAKLPWPVAVVAVLGVAAALGLLHGYLVTKLRLQPFVVTLFGLLFYRGMARFIRNDGVAGFTDADATLRGFAKGFWLGVPTAFWIFVLLGVIAAIFLNRTIWGRYLLALGRNEQAARFSGIHTDGMVILAYVVCSVLAGIAGVLFALDIDSFQPSGHGNFYELYAIAAAVLGGCSLRGGEGSILGVAVGTALMRMLLNATNLLDIPQTLEFAIVGSVILASSIVDELARRYGLRRRARLEAAVAEGKT